MEQEKPGSPANASADNDRRSKRRVKVTQPIRVRFSRPGWVGIDEVQATLNVCRTGLYFVTELTNYAKGLQVQVTYPYSDMPGAMNVEQTGEVVRIDRLAHGRSGVAIHLKPVEKSRPRA